MVVGQKRLTMVPTAAAQGVCVTGCCFVSHALLTFPRAAHAGHVVWGVEGGRARWQGQATPRTCWPCTVFQC